MQHHRPRAELSAADANWLFYTELAADYDETESCAFASAEREKLDEALAGALELIGPRPRVLDAGGGTGNASSLLLARDINPLVVDVSPEMLARWREKALALGAEPAIVCSTIEDFLLSDQSAWDMIVFSSVLHHLEDPLGALLAAGSHLEPGGVIVTCFDPTQAGRLGRILRKFDWLLWASLHYPRKIPGLAMRWMRRRRSDHDPRLAVGRRAERHAYHGLDDQRIAAAAQSAGLQVVAHRRRYDARYALTRLAFRAARRPSSFSLTLRNRA